MKLNTNGVIKIKLCNLSLIMSSLSYKMLRHHSIHSKQWASYWNEEQWEFSSRRCEVQLDRNPHDRRSIIESVAEVWKPFREI